jgi:hypothetical protein
MLFTARSISWVSSWACWVCLSTARPSPAQMHSKPEMVHMTSMQRVYGCVLLYDKYMRPCISLVNDKWQ